MRLVILDTQEIIARYMTYDHLFNFYPDGIRDLIKAAVFEAGHRFDNYRNADRDTEVYWMRSLSGRATREWEYAIDQALDNGIQMVDDRKLARFKCDRDVIHLVTEQIEEDVDKLIQSLTESRFYQVKEVPPQYNVPDWIGNALVVQIGHLYED